MSIETTAIKPAQLKILQSLALYQYLTAQQITLAAGYSPNSVSRCQSHIRALVALELLDLRKLPDTNTGQNRLLYTLSGAGWRVIANSPPPSWRMAQDTKSARLRPADFKKLTLPTMQHTLTLNDVLISASRFTANSTDISLSRSIHDFELSRNRPKVTFYVNNPGGSRIQDTVSINPDAFIEFSLQLAQAKKKLYKSLLIEVDRGTQTSRENEQKLRRKMVAYVHYAVPGGAYQTQFGADNVTIAYITAAGEKRRKQLLVWCADEMKKQGLEYASGMFRFIDLPQEYTDNPLPGLEPSFLWSLPIGYKIGTDSPLNLLWKP